MANPPWLLIVHLLRRGGAKVGAALPTTVTANGSHLQRLGTRALHLCLGPAAGHK